MRRYILDGAMLWFFSKDGRRLRVLTSIDPKTKEYIVDVRWPDRDAEMHRFRGESECAQFLAVLEGELDAQEWNAVGVRLTQTPLRHNA